MLAIRKLTIGLGKSLWSNTIFVLTFANETRPPPPSPSMPSDKAKKNIIEFFSMWLKQWEQKLRETVIEVGIEPDVAEKIPVVAAGYPTVQSLPGCDNWLSNLWVTSIKRMKEDSQPALLKANLRRLKSDNEVKPEDFKKPLHEQPILYRPAVQYRTAPLGITTLGDAAVAGSVGGVGAVGIFDGLMDWHRQSQKMATNSKVAAPGSDADRQDSKTGKDINKGEQCSIFHRIDEMEGIPTKANSF